MDVVYATGDGIEYAASDGTRLAFAVNVMITDRTAEDVLRWKELHDKGWEAMNSSEKAEWSAGMKGAYKHTDMNRVESAVEELVARFRETGSSLSLTTKTNWTRTDWPTVTDMNRYFGNVEALRVATGVNLSVPPTPTTKALFDYNKANDLEEILLAVEWWLDRVAASQNHSGDLYLGEV